MAQPGYNDTCIQTNPEVLTFGQVGIKGLTRKYRSGIRSNAMHSGPHLGPQNEGNYSAGAECVHWTRQEEMNARDVM